jgi:CheY-like chemotaxis protein
LFYGVTKFRVNSLPRTQLIALVDKNDDDRELTAVVLRSIGLVLAFRSEAEAELLIRTSTVPDLLVIDVTPPDDIALDMIHQMRSSTRFAHVPILALTTAFCDDHRIRLSGVNVCITKPILDLERFRRTAATMMLGNELDGAAA